MRGKVWSVDDERQLRSLVEEGKGTDEISRIMGKTRVSIKAKLFNLGLHLKIASDVAEQNLVPATVSATSSAPAIGQSTSESTLAVDQISDPIARAAVDLRLKLPEKLSSIEEKLKVLDAALKILEQPGLSRNEFSRLDIIVRGVKVYNDLFEKYVGYSKLEKEVLELRKLLASENTKDSEA